MSSLRKPTNVVPEPEAIYRIGAVARATGIRTDTLRAWERRYAAISPERTALGGRLYSEADVTRLRLARELIGRGHAISAIARLSEEDLRKLVAQPSAAAPEIATASWESTREAFLAAIARDDLAGAQRLLARAAFLLPTRDLVLQIVVPLLRTVGDGWRSRDVSIAHEHATSSLVRTQLGTLLSTFAPAQDAPVMLATTLAGELHELGALLAAIMGAGAGWRVIYLGPNLPAAEVVATARRTNAAVVALSVVGRLNRTSVEELERIVEGLPADVTLVVGGAGIGTKKVARARMFPTLDELATWLERRAVGT